MFKIAEPDDKIGKLATLDSALQTTSQVAVLLTEFYFPLQLPLFSIYTPTASPDISDKAREVERTALLSNRRNNM